MLKRLLAICLLGALASGVLAGMPFHTSRENGMAAMPCCKAAKKSNAKKATAARLCCLLNCTDPVPLTPSGGQLNFAAPLVTAIQFTPARAPHSLARVGLYSHKPLTPRATLQPKYIQNLALLI